MSGHISIYKYYCETEKAWIIEESKTKPTVCKNNTEHKIKEGSLHKPSPGYCEVEPISGIEPLSGECNLSDITLINIIEKFNLLARRVKIMEECAQSKGLIKYKTK